MASQENRNGNHLCGTLSYFLETVSKFTQTQQVDAKKITNFLRRSVRFECPRYLWIHYWQCFCARQHCNAARLKRLSVRLSATLCDCIKTVQARSRNLHLSFVKDSSLGIRKAFLKIRSGSSQPRELYRRGG